MVGLGVSPGRSDAGACEHLSDRRLLNVLQETARAESVGNGDVVEPGRGRRVEDLVAQALEQPDGGLRGLREHRIGDARRQQRDAHD